MALPPPPHRTRRTFPGETRPRRKAPPFAVRGKRQKKGLPAWLYGTPLLPLFTGIGAALFLALGVVVLSGGATVGAYMYFTHDLPKFDPQTLPQFETSRIYDRYGNVLEEISDPQAGNRFEVDLSGISPDLINATIAAEDRTFRTNKGIDPQAIIRAVRNTFIDSSYGSSGASTITMQVIKQAFPERYTNPTKQDKIRQVFMAYSLAQKYPKDEIMAFYLNNIYYGNRSYGIEAAAKNYFDTDAKHLQLWQSSFLAGLPQLPSLYDPTISPANLARARARQLYTLSQMVDQGYITPQEKDDAYAKSADPAQYHRFKADIPAGAPHFVNYVRQYVEEHYGAENLYRGGLKIYTTIDLDVQRLAEDVVRNQVQSEGKAGYRVSNGALVAIVPWSGQILCMVGSTDFYDQTKTAQGFNVAGEFNVAVNPRQPGSSIKPIVYALALEKGWYPAYQILDYHQTWDDGTEKGYTPNNFNQLHNGAVSMRDALQQSLNIPALKAMEYDYTKDGSTFGKNQGLQNFIDFAHAVGMKDSFNRPVGDYGLGISLALGGGEATVLQETNAYATFANLGRYVEASPIIRIEKNDGTIFKDPKTGKDVDNSKTVPKGVQVMDPGNAYLMTSVLSDNKARTPIFGASSPLILRDRPVAAKTGTTNDFRDGWTVGYTTQVAVGVWVGNNDNSPILERDGVETAAPIWNEFMRLIHSYEKAPSLLIGPDGNLPAKDFFQPASVVESLACTATGHKAPKFGGSAKELFVKGKEPQRECGELDAREQIELTQAWADFTKNNNLLKAPTINNGTPYAIGNAAVTNLEPKKTEFGRYTGLGSSRLQQYYAAVDPRYRPKGSGFYTPPSQSTRTASDPSETPEATANGQRVTQITAPASAVATTDVGSQPTAVPFLVPTPIPIVAQPTSPLATTKPPVAPPAAQPTIPPVVRPPAAQPPAQPAQSARQQPALPTPVVVVQPQKPAATLPGNPRP